MREKYQSGHTNKSNNNSPREDKNLEPDSSKQFFSDSKLNEMQVKLSSSSTKAEHDTGIFEYADAGISDPTTEEVSKL